MPRELLFQVSPETAHNEVLLNEQVAKLFQVAVSDIQKVVVVKRSIDARQKAIKFNIKANVFLKGGHNEKALGMDQLFLKNEVNRFLSSLKIV